MTSRQNWRSSSDSLTDTAAKQISQMNSIISSEAAKAVIRRNTEEVQSKGNFVAVWNVHELTADYGILFG
jgi:hypothetical protein